MTNKPLAEFGITSIPHVLGISATYPKLDLQFGSAVSVFRNFSALLPDMGIYMSPSVSSMAEAAQGFTSHIDWVSQIKSVNALAGSSLSQLALSTPAESVMAKFGRETKTSMDMSAILSIASIGESLYDNVTKSIFSSLDTSFIDDLLGQAKTFNMGDLAIDDLDDGLLAQQSELVQSIEQLPQFSELSVADRIVLVRFIKVIVTLAVTLGLLEISTELPAAGLILTCLGLGGMPVGHFVGEVVNKALTPKAIDEEA